jgi:hypothetical protein
MTREEVLGLLIENGMTSDEAARVLRYTQTSFDAKGFAAAIDSVTKSLNEDEFPD